MELDTIRHSEVFNVDAFGDTIVSFIGVGATGSQMARHVAKLGVRRIRLYDPDVVEAHNVPNQAFGLEHVGMKKTEALRAIIKAETGTVVESFPEAVGPGHVLEGVVFLLTDTMASRSAIWNSAIKYRIHIPLMIETRMASNNGRVYTVQPIVPAQVQGWEATLCSDDEVEPETACGASISVGPTAGFLGSLAVWQMIRWHQGCLLAKDGKDIEDPLEHEIIFSLQPLMTFTKNFG